MHLVGCSKLSELGGAVRSAVVGGGIRPGVSRKYQIFRVYFWDNTSVEIKYQMHEDVADRFLFHLIGYSFAKSPYLANYVSLNIITQTYGTEGKMHGEGEDVTYSLHNIHARYCWAHTRPSDVC